jgi:hypothetical protein
MKNKTILLQFQFFSQGNSAICLHKHEIENIKACCCYNSEETALCSALIPAATVCRKASKAGVQVAALLASLLFH